MIMKVDGLEAAEAYKAIEPELHRKIVAQIGEGGYIGYCHQYWRAKKRILWEDSGKRWRSPAELNPHIFFD